MPWHNNWIAPYGGSGSSPLHGRNGEVEQVDPILNPWETWL
jgi:hypothetical protein